LALVNAAGTQLANSQQADTANETITRSLTAGTYAAHFFAAPGVSGGNDCYTLRVSTGGSSPIVSAGESDNNLGAALKILPNPASTVINISISGQLSNQAVITVTDMSGRTVLTKRVQGNTTALHSLTIGKLAKGIYLVNVVDGTNKPITSRLTKF
jgi:hypothetical protein